LDQKAPWRQRGSFRVALAGSGLVASQLFDNTMIAAGLLEDARGMVKRMNELMEIAIP